MCCKRNNLMMALGGMPGWTPGSSGLVPATARVAQGAAKIPGAAGAGDAGALHGLTLAVRAKHWEIKASPFFFMSKPFHRQTKEANMARRSFYALIGVPVLLALWGLTSPKHRRARPPVPEPYNRRRPAQVTAVTGSAGFPVQGA